jgi:hypothetical protein
MGSKRFLQFGADGVTLQVVYEGRSKAVKLCLVIGNIDGVILAPRRPTANKR